MTQIVGRGSAATPLHAATMRRTELSWRRVERLLHRLLETATLHARHESIKFLGEPIDHPRRGRIQRLVFLDRDQHGRRPALLLDDDRSGARHVGYLPTCCLKSVALVVTASAMIPSRAYYA